MNRTIGLCLALLLAAAGCRSSSTTHSTADGRKPKSFRARSWAFTFEKHEQSRWRKESFRYTFEKEWSKRQKREFRRDNWQATWAFFGRPWDEFKGMLKGVGRELKSDAVTRKEWAFGFKDDRDDGVAFR